MSYEVSAVFSGDVQKQARLHKFLSGAMSAGNTANTLQESFGVTVTNVGKSDLGIEVTFNSMNVGKAFVGWACKECELTAECVVYGPSGVANFSYPEQPNQVSEKRQAAVQQIEIEQRRLEQQQTSVASTSAMQGIADAALQSMLKAAKEEGIAEGRFQILKNIMGSCDTLNEMLQLTGVKQEEFVALFNKFNQKGK